MSERQLMERTCDECKKVVVLSNNDQLTPERIADLERWFLVAQVKYDGHGNFIPVPVHLCSSTCVVKKYIGTEPTQPTNGVFAATEQPKDMEHFQKLAKTENVN